MDARSADIPAHRAVRVAVQQTGDVELAGWTSAEDDYVMVPVEFSEARHHAFFELTPVVTSHPNGVLVAWNLDNGRLQVTSGQPVAVWQVLRADPDLVDADTIVQLLGPFDQVEYLGPGSEPAVEESEDGWRCDLRVRRVPDGDRERWLLVLAATPEWRVQ